MDDGQRQREENAQRLNELQEQRINEIQQRHQQEQDRRTRLEIDREEQLRRLDIERDQNNARNGQITRGLRWLSREGSRSNRRR